MDHIDPKELCATVLVKGEGSPSVTINKSDYDPRAHVLCDAEGKALPKAAQAAAAAELKAENGTAAELEAAMAGLPQAIADGTETDADATIFNAAKYFGDLFTFDHVKAVRAAYTDAAANKAKAQADADKHHGKGK